MFSIYGESGRVFRGAMEDLWRVDALRALTRTRRLEAQGGHGPRTTAVTASDGGGSVPAMSPARAALSAYAQVADGQPQRHLLSRVADVMSRGVCTVAADVSAREAWQQLAQAGLGQAPVTGAQGELVGLLTRAELLRAEQWPEPDAPALAWRAWWMQPVAALMLSPVPAVAEETDLRRVARVLLDAHLPGLPVVTEAGQITGFISRSDILRAVVHDPPLDLWS